MVSLLKNLDKTAPECNKLIKVVTSCLLNSINEFEEGQKVAIEEDIIPLTMKLLKSSLLDKNEDETRLFLFLIHSLSEFELGRSHLSQPKMIQVMVELISSDIKDSTLESLLEIMTSLLNEEIKITLVQTNLFQTLITIINKKFCDAGVKKLILDLITLTLTNSKLLNFT